MSKATLVSFLSAFVLAALGSVYYIVPYVRLQIRESDETATRINQALIFSALDEYYGTHQGEYPSDLNLLIGENMGQIPPAKPSPHHPPSNAVTTAPNRAEAIADEGGWAYVFDPKKKKEKEILVNCTHTDLKGSVWASY